MYTEEEIIEAFEVSTSKSDVCRILDMPINGSYLKKVSRWIEEYNIDVSHFIATGAEKNRKYPLVTKVCPVCSSSFSERKGNPREKTTCSHSCSNSYFRSGKDNGKYIDGETKENGYRETDYRIICFKHWDRKCSLCEWDFSVDVHHIDSNHENNKKENLIPLCPNHHRLTIMTEHKDWINELIEEKVKEKWNV